MAEAAIQAIRSHGYGLSSVRFICGTQVRRWTAGRCGAAGLCCRSGIVGVGDRVAFDPARALAVPGTLPGW